MMSLSVVPKLRLGEYKKPDFVPKLGVILLKQFFFLKEGAIRYCLQASNLKFHHFSCRFFFHFLN